ncbi:MAG: hypothetical protein N2422_06555 [Rhodobacteraceae bacterium]|nr:hypothetical protein [Paracoccaceae bacterium]
MRHLLVAAALAALLAPGTAGAQQSEVVFSYKAWEVRVVQFDDGSLSCVAQVSHGSDSFSVWADSNEAVRLQFYSEAWDFGEGSTADLEVQIDRRGPWTMTNAELYLQSVLFDMPDTNDGVRFLTEVMQGNVMRLRNDSGQDVMAYSLAGSSASINALIQCVDGLNRSSNPFN